MTGERLYVELEARVAQFERNFRRATRSANDNWSQVENRSRRAARNIEQTMAGTAQRVQGSLSNAVRGFGSGLGGALSLTPAGLLAGAGIGAITASLASMSLAAAESERVHRRLDAVLKVTGGTAGLTARQIDEFAKAVESSTMHTADEVKSAAAALATFTSISGDRFKDVITISTSMVEVYGGNLREWTDKIARAFDDPIAGFAALRKAGFSLTEEQLRLAEGFTRVGDTAAAQKVVADALNESIAGVGASGAGGLAGGFRQASNAASDFFSTLASKIGIASGAVSIVDGLAGAFRRLTNAMNGKDVATLMGEQGQRLAKIAELQAQREAGTITTAGRQQLELLEQRAVKVEARIASMRDPEEEAAQIRAKAAAEDARLDAVRTAAASQLDDLTARTERLATTEERRAKLGVDRETRLSDARKMRDAGLDDETYQRLVASAEDLHAREIAALDKLGAASARRASGGGGGGSSRADTYQREREAIQAKIEALALEAEAVGQTAYETDRAKTVLELNNAAKAAGIALTPQVIAANQQLADSYAAASEKVREATQRQEQAQALQREFGSIAKSAISGLIDGTKSLNDVLADTLKRLVDLVLQAALLGEGPLAGAFGGIGGGGGIIGAIFGGFFSEGGFTGDGGKHEPAGIVHRGEYVFSKAAVQKAGAGNLDAMHRSLKGFADGGYVGPRPISTPRVGPSSGVAGGAQAINLTSNVTVNASGGTPEQNADLAKKVSSEVKNSVRQLVAQELRQQMRPGNMLSR